MFSRKQCAAFVGLRSEEITLGVDATARHSRLLSAYHLNLKRSPIVVRDMIVGDMHPFRNLGVLSRAADLLVVLRLFLTEQPEVRVDLDQNLPPG